MFDKTSVRMAKRQHQIAPGQNSKESNVIKRKGESFSSENFLISFVPAVRRNERMGTIVSWVGKFQILILVQKLWNKAFFQLKNTLI